MVRVIASAYFDCWRILRLGSAGKSYHSITTVFLVYKDVKLLKRFTNDNGKIMPRRVTGTSAKMHRKVVGAIKRARTIGLMPFVDNGSE